MPRGSGSRFVLETLFLLALAAALAFAEVRAPVVVGVMLAGWLLMAVLERAAWRQRPHFGAGFPPQYYAPAVELPPAQPLELVHGYPGAQRDEAPTWIASAALRAEVLGEWPVATVAKVADESEDDRWLVVELPPVPVEEPEERVVAESVAVPLPPPPGPELDLEPLPEPVPEPEPEPEPGPEPEPAPLLPAATARMARYHADPLADPAPRRRFRRVAVDGNLSLEVPAMPSGPRPMPSRALPDRPA